MIPQRRRKRYVYDTLTGRTYRPADDIFELVPDEHSPVEPHEIEIWSTGMVDAHGNDVLDKDIVEFERGGQVRLGVVHYHNGVTVIETNDIDTENRITVAFTSVKAVRVMGNRAKYQTAEPFKPLAELCWAGETSEEKTTYDTVVHATRHAETLVLEDLRKARDHLDMLIGSHEQKAVAR